MAKVETYSSVLKKHKYAKLYSKNVKTLLNARFDLINPNDIESAKISAYEKSTNDGMLTSSCFLQFVKLKNSIKLRFVSFMLHKKIDDDDLKPAIAKMLSEQMDIEEELDVFDFAKL